MSPEFMAGERVTDSRKPCTECGKPAEGNHGWTDGSGQICDACVALDNSFSPELQGKITETCTPGNSDFKRAYIVPSES